MQLPHSNYKCYYHFEMSLLNYRLNHKNVLLRKLGKKTGFSYVQEQSYSTQEYV